MYSRSLASLFYLAAALLLATLISSASALPTEPGRTLGDVVSENRNMACRMGGCFIKNTTSSSTDSSAVAAADAGTDATDSTANGAFSLRGNDFIAPTVLAGASLFLLL